MSTRIGTFLGCIFGLFLAGEPALAAPAAYPDREIRLIVPYKTGGQSDLTARKLAKIIRDKKLLPQPVVVVNIPGANTQEGLRAAMRADPDGYTLLLHHSALVTMKALGRIPMSWHDFEMIGQALEMSNSLVVNLDSHFKTISEFIEAAKKEPGKYHIAIPGVGGVAHLALLDVLWVAESRRGTGLGACLLAQLEQDAARQGAKRLELNTFGFQAPGFYEKLGYRRFGAVEPAVGEYGHYFYVKEL